PLEALKAQAIAARSYGFMSINKHKNYGFDLCTTQDCQVYRGYVSEHDSTDLACSQTEGQVLTYDGKIVETYYYAYSGGATLNSEDVWMNALDYCRGKVDEYYSDYRWAVHYTMDELTQEMVNRGKNIGEVQSVQITKRHSTGAVAEVTFVGTKGSATVTKSTILSALGLKSFMFAINDEQFVWNKDGMATVTDASVSVIGASEQDDNVKDVYVIGADGGVSSVSASDLRISNGTMVSMPQGTVSAGWTDDPVSSDVVYIAGSGWGHGVGMPQTSARNMADLGFNCEQILKYYYEGTEIGNIADFQ
ncbi:MAG: SpoIID/LytB domain-containing protein, partial [Firmicutes bacterium]|nr:SpoIID/LytB domain-containing protein [Bacillota bacterium]